MSVITQSKAGFSQPALDAAREGRAIQGRVNARTGIDTESVLTDASFLRVIPDGERLIVAGFYMNLGTNSDWVTAEFVVTENEDGSGAVTVLSPLLRVSTGAASSGTLPSQITMPVPMCITRSKGHAFSARVQGNDASAALTLAYAGWTETDTDLN